ncbi:MAG: toxin-antitoxin system TumE family protein [Sulfuricella sp.]
MTETQGARQGPLFFKGTIGEPVFGSTHSFKYSLFYGYPGKRVVGYDNERGKSDHRHMEGGEEPYLFSTVEVLVADFLSDVRHARGKL